VDELADSSLDEAGYQTRRGSGGEWAINEGVEGAAATHRASREKWEAMAVRDRITTAAEHARQMTVPMTSATITVLYSTSFPVLNVLSQ
jgi:hypothetical protein